MPHRFHKAVSGRRLHLRCMLGVAVLVLSLPCMAQADMTIAGYQSYRHDRFFAGDDKAFIGQAFDWSGVGKTNGEWVTMISQSYFLSAAHLPPGDGDTVTFFEGNSTSIDGQKHTYTIEAGGRRISSSDLWLGKLSTPLNPTHNINYYPILELGIDASYLGMELLNYGFGTTSDRVGRNAIDVIEDTIVSGVTGNSMRFDYHASADETLLQGRDSGGPSFTNWNGELALLGIHWFLADNSTYSGDTFVPHYLDAINSSISGETLTVVPEPSTLALWSLACVVGVGYGWRSKRRPSA